MRCVMRIFQHLLVSAMLIGVPAAALAQFSDKGAHVEVKTGTRLCSSIAVSGVLRTVDQRRVFWRVTSPMRVNGTQTVSALVYERVYNRQSGDSSRERVSRRTFCHILQQSAGVQGDASND